MAYDSLAQARSARSRRRRPGAASRRGLLLAGGLAGAATMLGLLGYYVMLAHQGSGRESAPMMEDAAAVVESAERCGKGAGRIASG